MEFTVGALLEGKVKSITKFGAFITLPENRTGMVHISEVANTYVSDIHDHLTEGQDVKVKVIGIDPAGKHCVVVGRSNIVGKPLALLLLQADATVTVCHSKTPDLADQCRRGASAVPSRTAVRSRTDAPRVRTVRPRVRRPLRRS